MLLLLLIHLRESPSQTRRFTNAGLRAQCSLSVPWFNDREFFSVPAGDRLKSFLCKTSIYLQIDDVSASLTPFPWLLWNSTEVHLLSSKKRGCKPTLKSHTVTESAAMLNTLRASANTPLSPQRSEVLDLAKPWNPCNRIALLLVPVKF